MYHLIYLLALLLWLGACQQPAKKEQTASGPKAPNIIFILTDDLGYGDLGVLFQNGRAAQGKPFHQTPHLDRIAREGVLLTRHYVPAPVCAPSRASLMLGLHQGHANIRNNQFDKALANNHTIASVLKQAGYATGIIGKWGLQGLEGNSPQSWEAYPTKRGFDYFLGYVRHRDGHNHYPAHLAPDRPRVELYQGNEEISSQLQGVYTTDLFTAAAKKWITTKKRNNPDQPFFLYLAYDTPHAGLQVASGAYPQGGGLKGGVQWKGERGSFINTVNDTIDSYIHPDYAAKDWPEVHRRFASMVRRIDDGVGDLMQLLKDLNIDEETLVIFTSDNGPHKESYGYGEYDPTFFDSYGPLDGIKRDVWEGGIRVPAFAWWPGKVKAGARDDTPTGFHDWLPTFARLAGVPAPANTDGVSLLPLLTGEGKREGGRVYIEYQVNGQTPEYDVFHASHKGQAHGQMQVLYLDGYKGVRTNMQSAGDDFRIYDTSKDPQEITDLAGSSAYFTALQKRMQEQVLQLRRPDTSARRPYDELAVPAIDSLPELGAGLTYQLFEVASPWVPQISSLEQKPAKSGISKSLDAGVSTAGKEQVIEYRGLLEVPQRGEYTFSLQTAKGALLRLHEATLIDAGKGYRPGTEQKATIRLEKGYHPLQLVYMQGKAEGPLLQIKWSGPDFAMQPLAPEKLFHANGKSKAGF